MARQYFFRQYILLMWKNFTLRRRRPILLVMEIIVPIAVISLLALVRTRNLRINMPECHLPRKSLPSAGAVNLFQDIICQFNNTCRDAEQNKQEMNNPNLGQLLVDMDSLLSNAQLGQLAYEFLQDGRTLVEVYSDFTRLVQNASISPVSLNDLIDDPNLLRTKLKLENGIIFSDRAWNGLISSPLNINQLIRNPSTTAIILSSFMENSTLFQDQWNSILLQNIQKYGCNWTLEYYFTLNPSSLTTELSDTLCNLTENQLNNFTSSTVESLNLNSVRKKTSGILLDVLGNGNMFQLIIRYPTLYKVLQDFQNPTKFDPISDSFKKLSQDFRTLLPQNFSLSTFLYGNDTSEKLKITSQIFCGKENNDLVSLFDKIGSTGLINQSALPAPSRRQKRSASNTTTDTCVNFIDILSSGPLQLLWQQIKNYFIGKVLYTPDTPLTRKFVKRAGFLRDGLIGIYHASKRWHRAVSPQIKYLISESSNMEMLRLFLSTCSSFGRNSSAICGQLLNLIEKPENETEQTNLINIVTSLDMVFGYIEQYMSCFDFLTFIPIKNKDDLEKDSNVLSRYPHLWAAVIFDGVSANENEENTTHVTVRIRMKSHQVDSTDNFKVLDRFWRPGPRRNPYVDLKYFQYGFIHLQEMLQVGIVETLNGHHEDVGVEMQQFPYPCYINDRFTSAIARNLPMLMVLGWIFTVSMNTRAIVYEKEKRLKEVMKVMGLTNGVHWLAWFTTATVLMTLSILGILIFMKVGNVLMFASAGVMFVFLASFMVASIMQCFLISVFFSKANLAAVCGGIIYFLCYLPIMVVQLHEEDITESSLFGLSLFAQVAFGIGCQYVARYEEQGIGIQWSNISLSPSPEDPFSLMKCIGMLWIDSFIYWLLTWYIEEVFPGKYGVPRRWYFLFTRSYWCGISNNYTPDENQSHPLEMAPRAIDENFEDDPLNLRVGVYVKQLSKAYKSGTKPALDELSIKFFENQITSFLGHNGAGKTTTISILTGLFPPTSGTALIYDRDIRTDMFVIRESLGLCPQYNVLFDYLTVEEHIWFYGLLKGLPKSSVENEITKYVHDVGLIDKRKDLCRNLSGGMKRKLSVAMAFVGGSKTVVLDEPTAGVDPYARRSIWQLLSKSREGRTIILTTHHMDEADALGDRIAIISQGKLKCCGSSMFLKKQYGKGYYLVLAKDAERSTVSTETISDFILSHVADAELIENVSTELTYLLPSVGASDGRFLELFDGIDNHMNSLEITSYGLSDTTLEEVFLSVADDPSTETSPADLEEASQRLTDDGAFPRPVTRLSFRRSGSVFGNCVPRNREEELDENLIPCGDASEHSLNSAEISSSSRFDRLTGTSLIGTQMIAMWTKRFHNIRRSKKGIVAEIILPPILIFLAVLLSTLSPSLEPLPPMELHPWLMAPKRGDPHMHVFYSNNNPNDTFHQRLESLIRTPLGEGGVRCMSPDLYTIKGFKCDLSYENTKWSTGWPGKIDSVSPGCSCKTGDLKCPAPLYGGQTPSSRLLPTTDFLHKLSHYNISDYLVKTNSRFRRKRYGGFSFGNKDVIIRPQNQSNITLTDLLSRLSNATGNETDGNFWFDLQTFIRMSRPKNKVTTVWFNNKGYAASTAYLNIFYNLFLRLGMGEKAKKMGISVVNNPLNRSASEWETMAARAVFIDVLMSVCVIFALSFIPASFILFLITERVSNSKHLQIVSGLNSYVYWIANYMWDIVNYIIPCIICILIFVAFNKQAYVSPENAPIFIYLMIIYGFAIIPMMYPASFLFDTPSTAFVVLSSANLMFGMITTLATFIIELLQEDDEELRMINDVLKKVFLLLPQYCLGRGLIDLSKFHVMQSIPLRRGVQNLLDWDILGKNIFCMHVEAIFFFLIVLLIEKQCFCVSRLFRPKISVHEPSLEDEDVKAERNRVASGGANNDILRLIDLTKVYRTRKKKPPAVSHLSLGVRRGECFGLLGVNGAGKTSTFKMLTGEHNVTNGDAFVNGHSIISDLVEVHRDLGYCPQFDALNMLLTGRETLTFYAQLRGIPRKHLKDIVDWAIRKLGLKPHADKTAEAYSGGNRRKLSTAVSLIGDPKIIFLDEPTSGMDPGARRFLWNCITDIVKEGRSVVLTTHSMEECEVLCHRLAIMVHGTFRCLGSVQHLKARFGDGYTLSIKLSSTQPQTERVMQFMTQYFPNCLLREANCSILEYHIHSDTTLTEVFTRAQEAIADGIIEDFSVRQTSLDEVFIHFAKGQLPNEEALPFEIPCDPTNISIGLENEFSA